MHPHAVWALSPCTFPTQHMARARTSTGSSVTCSLSQSRAIVSFGPWPIPKTPRLARDQERSATMLQPQSQSGPQKSQFTSPTPNTYTPAGFSGPVEQATIGRSLVIKGDVSGAESLFIDGQIEGTISVPGHRVTIGRNGVVTANIEAKEVVVMGKVKGNLHCQDRVDIRSEGSLTGDVVTARISVEDGAVVKGGVEVKAVDQKKQQTQQQQAPAKPATSVTEAPKAAAATAGA